LTRTAGGDRSAQDHRVLTPASLPYAYFRDVVMGGTRDYKMGSIDQSGSKKLVALVSRTPCCSFFADKRIHTYVVCGQVLMFNPRATSSAPESSA
jgi:hypothetical protein